MKKTIYSLISFFLFTLPFISAASDVKDKSSTSSLPLCAAQVKNGVAAFYFPITNKGEWVWYRNSTEDKAMEYSWEIVIASPLGEYDFGYYLFKFSGQPQKKGSLNELLRDAQLSAWLSATTPDGGTAGDFRDDLKVRGGIVDQWLIVAIKDNYTSNTILKDKPKTAQFVVRHPDKSKSSICDAPIKYIESNTQNKN